jgi:hypothetical protein
MVSHAITVFLTFTILLPHTPKRHKLAVAIILIPILIRALPLAKQDFDHFVAGQGVSGSLYLVKKEVGA